MYPGIPCWLCFCMKSYINCNSWRVHDSSDFSHAYESVVDVAKTDIALTVSPYVLAAAISIGDILAMMCLLGAHCCSQNKLSECPNDSRLPVVICSDTVFFASTFSPIGGLYYATNSDTELIMAVTNSFLKYF